MRGDSYTRPPLVAREAPPRWVAVWRFRLAALLLLVVVALIAISLIKLLAPSTAGYQNPGIGAPAPGLPAAASQPA